MYVLLEHEPANLIDGDTRPRGKTGRSVAHASLKHKQLMHLFKFRYQLQKGRRYIVGEYTAKGERLYGVFFCKSCPNGCLIANIKQCELFQRSEVQ